MRYLIAFLLAALLASPALAKEAAPLAEDPVVEARLMDLASELRCLVCQNQTLAGSEADLAKDFRREIRAMIHQGLSDQEIIDFLVDRYGDFIRYRPPLKGITLFLWFGPLILVALGGTALAVTLRRRKAQLAGVTPLSEEDRRRAEALLAGKEEKDRS